ncbi:MAG TPA: hypothetical protein VFA98_11250 [Thermoanaerobaculia bacterium]|nr:hypothetical protein [Thermoanaerobaculia bacterium]
MKSESEELSRIRARIAEIDDERIKLLKRCNVLERNRALRKFTCVCVRLGKDIGVTNMSEQEAAGRNGLQIGLVAETLSALKGCPSCRGSGIPSWKKSYKKETAS